jgi:hypothetical protein
VVIATTKLADQIRDRREKSGQRPQLELILLQQHDAHPVPSSVVRHVRR